MYTKNTFKLSLLFVIFVCLILTSASFAATYNLRDGDWSQVNTDTTDPWAIGCWDGTNFTLYQWSTVNQSAFGAYGSVGYNWDGGGDWDSHGNLAKNTGESADQVINAWTAYWDPQDLVGGAPVDGALRTAVQFTAPEAATYQLNFTISGKSTKGGGTTVDCYLYVNGVQLGTVKELRGQVMSADGYSGPQGDTPQVTFNNVLSLAAGDKVMVGISCAFDGPTADATGFECEVSTIETTGKVQGVISDQYGNPVEGVSVTLGSYAATTAADGSYEIIVGEDATAILKASKQGCFPASVEVAYGIGQTVTQNLAITVREGSATFYVNSNTGNDSNDGLTPETAWATFHAAASSGLLTPGDTVILEGYFNGLTISGINGTADAYITIKASDNGAEVYVNDGATTVNVTTSNYIKIEGFDISGGTRGMNLGSCSYVEIAFCTFGDIHNSGAGEGCGVWNDASSNIYYHNNIFRNIGAPGTGPQGAIVFVNGSYDSRVHNNTFVYASNALRAWNHVARIDVKNNILVDMYGGGGNGWIHTDGAGWNCANAFICDHNLFYSSTGSEIVQYDSNSTHTNDIVGNPGFVDYFDKASPDNDFSLTAISMSVDAGVDVGLPYNGTAPDLGAIESEYTAAEDFGYIEGYVNRAATKYILEGTALPNAKILFDQQVGFVVTDATGYYSMKVLPGTYSATASYGVYADPVTVEGITVGPNETVQQNFRLENVVGSTYYVAPDGDDWGGDGSEDFPFASPDTPDDWEMLQPGDTVIVKEGVYGDMESLRGYEVYRCTGDTLAPISYIAQGNAVIDMNHFLQEYADEMVCGMFFGKAGYDPTSGVILDGFEFTNCQFGIYLCDGSNENIVANCYFHDLARPAQTAPAPVSGVISAICYSVSRDSYCLNNIFANIVDNPENSIYDCQSNERTVAAITAPGMTRIKFYNNTFDNTTTAIDHWVGGSDNHFANNVIINMTGDYALRSDSEGNGFFAEGLITADNNLFYNNAKYNMSPMIDGADNFIGNPMLDENYAPLEGSLAIDAGINVGYAFKGIAPDLGAIESDYDAVPYYQVIGTVKDPDGEAVGGATVTLNNDVTFTSLESGVLDTLPYRLVSADLAVFATKEGYSEFDQMYALQEGVNEIDIVLSFVQASISGTVTNSVTGSPVAGATVAITDGASTTTNAAGQYTLLSPVADVEITVSATNYDPLTVNVTGVLGGYVTKDIALVPNVLVWNAYDDFSETSNPNDVWTYGNKVTRAEVTEDNPNPAPGAFTIYNQLADGGQGDKAWRMAGDWDFGGYTGYRPVAGVHSEWGQYREPYMIYLGSTFRDNSAIRFTAPYAADFTFDITISYNGMGGAGVMAYIDVNDVNRVNKPLSTSYQNGAAETSYLTDQFTLSLNAGDVVDASTWAYGNPVASVSMLRKFEVTAPPPEQTYDDIDGLNALAALEDGAGVNFTTDLVVIAASTDFADNTFFASSEDRLAGIKCVPSAALAAVAAGDRVKVKGIVRSDADGKYIEVSEITSQTAGTALASLGMTGDVLTNNVLVRVWGVVNAVGDGTLTINNGSGDVVVKLNAATTATVGDYVTVTGIATANGVQTRNADDVLITQGPAL